MRRGSSVSIGIALYVSYLERLPRGINRGIDILTSYIGIVHVGLMNIVSEDARNIA